MSENTNELSFEFMPKTDETFIAPNDKFNSFTKNRQNKRPEEDDNQKEETMEAVKTSKRKNQFSMQSNDKFVDFIVKQFKSDGIVCTLDENERQIYYCYYCHQYVNDFDLIQTHIDSSLHLNKFLNGISLKSGLDKEFVIESVSEKKPKNLIQLIHKELGKIPLHLKHYYFRNDIRLMDVMPPNAYFCKSCNQSIPNFKSIETHLLTETHESSQQKLTLMQMIDKSEDSTLRIGLQFLTEDKIPDSTQVVYECELCNCFDCNNEKMFSHIKSTEHRINLLKQYNYDTKDLSIEEINVLVKEIDEKHSSGSVKTSQCNKKLKSSPDLTSKSNSSTNSPLNETIETNLKPNTCSDSSEPQKPKLGANICRDFLLEDTLLPDFENHKIIKTFESDGREIYFCCFCDQYYNTFQSLERHIEEPTHQKLQTNENNISKGLNKKFSIERLFDKSTDNLSQNESSEDKTLNDISVVIKHFYYKRGIKHTGAQEYFCRLCQTHIVSFDAIEDHFKSESHLQIEERPTKFNDLLFQTNQPIIGLKYILENINEKSKHILYECTLCDYSNDFCQMFVHINCFSHQFKVLRKLSPNNRVFKEVKEKEISLKSSDLLKEEISKIELQFGCGFVTKVYDLAQELQNPTQSQSQIESEKCNDFNETKDQKSNSMSCVSPICMKTSTHESQSQSQSQIPIENQKPNCEATETKAIPVPEDKPSIPKLSEAVLLSTFQTLFAVELHDENEASILVSIVESLKDCLIEYYMNTISPEMRPILEKKISESTDNYNISH